MIEGLRQLEDFYNPIHQQDDVPVESARQAHKAVLVANRTIQAMQPASPRVPSPSSWWSALKFRISAIGSFFVRIARCLTLTAAERADQGRALKNEIRSLLKSGDSSAIRGLKISAACEKAVSYGIDLGSLIPNVLSEMNQKAIEDLEKACAEVPELKWLERKISETNHAKFREKIQEHLSFGIAKSSLMLANGIDMQDERQACLWAELDAVYAKAAELDANISTVIESVVLKIRDPHLLLPIMQYNFTNGKTCSLVADLLSSAIFSGISLKYSKNSLIAMNDHELHAFGKLTIHPDLSHLHGLYKEEESRRTKVAQGAALALEYRARIETLVDGGIEQCSNADTDLLNPAERAAVMASVLSEVDARMVFKVAGIERIATEIDQEIVNAAKLELEKPPVASLSDEKLLAYLDLRLSESAKDLIRKELNDRADAANRNAVYVLNNVLHQLVDSSQYSFRNLVLGVIVASEHVNRAKKLQKGATPVSSPVWGDALKGVKLENVIEGFKCLGFLSNELKKIKSNSVATSASLCIDAILEELDSNQDRGAPKSKDQNALEEMLKLCFPMYSGALIESELPQLSTKTTSAYFDALERSAVLPSLSRKYRDAETTLSVCPQLITDMRTPVIILDGKPFDGFSHLEHTQRAKLLEKELRAIGPDATDQQIHSVSILLSQETANTMTQVVRNECQFPLTDIEKSNLGSEDKASSSQGIIPMNPERINIVELETNGYFKVKVIFAEDKCQYGFVGSTPLEMNPEKSRFKATVVHLVSPDGKILPGGPVKGVFEREFTA